MEDLLQTIPGATSDQIFGRTKELRIISEAISLSGYSGTSLLIIDGPAGIGKTSIIQTALGKYVNKKCFKLYGKFENHRENTPYSAFRQAFELWGQQILMLPDEEFDVLKESTTSALQTNIRAVTEVFNELEVFFSRKQLLKNKNDADPFQIKARFYYFFRKFLKSVTSLGYRLIIFLDDLQWADKASFQLLDELVQKNEIPGLLFITATRRVVETSTRRQERLKAFIQLKNTTYLSLKPLTRSAIGSMVPVQWKFSKQNIIDFRNYLWLESGGNPFRITEIFKIIQRDKLNLIKPEDPVFWESLPKLNGAEDSVTFMREQLRNLPFHQLQVIASASCLGYSFESSLLKKILSFPAREVQACLMELTKMEFLIRKKSNFVFTHDTIFSAANSLLSNVEKCEIHQKAGIILLDEMDKYEHTDFFRAVNHLNKAQDLSGSEKVYSDEHLLLNIRAAKLAITKTAFEIAYDYYTFADKLFRQNSSNIKIQDPALISFFESSELDVDNLQFLINFGYTETMFLLHQFESALKFAGELLDMNISRHQRLKATLIKLSICSALIYQKNIPHVHQDGLQSLEKALAEYGIIFPKDPDVMLKESAEDCRILYQKAEDYHENVDFTKKINPDKEYHDLVNLVTTSMTFLYYMDVRKNLLMTTKTLLIGFEKGYAPVSPVLFAASFLTSSFSEENRSLAHLLGKLSLKMIETEPFKRYAHVVNYVATLNFLTWEYHYNICKEKLKESVQLAYEAGDPHYASFCSTIIRVLNSYSGMNLIKRLEAANELEKDHHIFFISSSDNDEALYLAGLKPGFEEGDFIFSEELIQESEHNLSSRYHLMLTQQKLNYIAGYFDVAIEAGAGCESLENVYSGFQIELEHFLFYSLSLLQSAYKDPEMLPEVLLKVNPMLEEFRRLSKFRSGNFLHKVYIIEAELAKCKGDFEQATLFYDKAIREAYLQGFVHHAAIAAERAFEYYRDKGRDDQAKHYLKKSVKYYTGWGAMAKVTQLQKRYPSINKEKKPSDNFVPAARYETIREILSRTGPENQLELPKLGNSLISLIRKESQAKKGAILLFQQNRWNLLAADPVKNSDINKPLPELIEIMPVSVLNYSIKKGNKVVLQDIFSSSLFAEDPYLIKEKPQNISIFPIKQNGETIGLIYLEDCLIPSEADKNLFLVMVELASTTFANAVYYENNNLLNKELKVQERNRIEAVIESQEKERQRIARELHDSLGQMLALTKITLSGINLNNGDRDNATLLGKIDNLIDESCREVRTISHDLMPPELENRTITSILENLINKNRELNGIAFESHLTEPGTDLSAACKLTLYRVLQEIIQNIIKHASASKVVISLTEADDLVNLLVEDNGKGFNTQLTTMGLGLKNIYARVKLLDGYLDIDSSINNGTVFNVSIPINSN